MLTINAFNPKRKFYNQRRWREFVATVQCSVSDSTVMRALREQVHCLKAGWWQVSGESRWP